MSAADFELPEPQDHVEAKAVADIREHGWHCVLVRAREDDDESAGPWSEHPPANAAYEAQFSYTVGLWQRFAHPEIVLVGTWQHAHSYLNRIGELVHEGRRFTVGSQTDDLLEGYVVRFDAVGERCREALLTWSSWANFRRPFDALQLVLPDRDGRWPEHTDYDGFAQPALEG